MSYTTNKTTCMLPTDCILTTCHTCLWGSCQIWLSTWLLLHSLAPHCHSACHTANTIWPQCLSHSKHILTTLSQRLSHSKHNLTTLSQCLSHSKHNLTTVPVTQQTHSDHTVTTPVSQQTQSDHSACHTANTFWPHCHNACLTANTIWPRCHNACHAANTIRPCCHNACHTQTQSDHAVTMPVTQQTQSHQSTTHTKHHLTSARDRKHNLTTLPHTANTIWPHKTLWPHCQRENNLLLRRARWIWGKCVLTDRCHAVHMTLWKVRFLQCDLNPFTAQACKIPRLKSTCTHLQIVYFLVLKCVCFQYSAFWWKSFHMLILKGKKKKKGFAAARKWDKPKDSKALFLQSNSETHTGHRWVHDKCTYLVVVTHTHVC